MAAMHLAIMGLVKAGDHVVAGRALFGSCRWILSNWAPRFGVETDLRRRPRPRGMAGGGAAEHQVFLIESPANPLLELTDIDGVTRIAREIGAKVIVDNVFATPIFQSPLKLGADIVVYSATKHIDGGGRVMGGAILGGAALMEEAYKRSRPPPRTVAVAVQRLGAAQGPGDAGTPRAGAGADRRGPGRPRRGPPQGQARAAIPGRADHPQYGVARRSR